MEAPVLTIKLYFCIILPQLGHGSGGTKGGTLFNNIFLKKNKEDNNTPNRTIVSSDEPHQNAGDDPIYESIIEPWLPLQSDNALAWQV